MYLVSRSIRQRSISGKRLEELVFDVTREALASSGVQRQAVDSVTIAACDELDGRSISSMLLAMPAGAYLKDEIKCTDTGLYALLLGAMRIESGLHDIGLVVSWNKSSIAPVEDVMRMRWIHSMSVRSASTLRLPMGFSLRPWRLDLAFPEDDVTGAVARAYGRAASNPRGAGGSVPTPAEIAKSPYVATPLRKGHQAPLTDGAVAMVIVSERWLNRHPQYRPLARIAGVGWRTDSYNLGRERLSNLRSFSESVDEARQRAGVAHLEDIDIFELDCQTGYHHLAYAKALGIRRTAASIHLAGRSRRTLSLHGPRQRR